MNYYQNIKSLIENNIVLQKTYKLIEENNAFVMKYCSDNRIYEITYELV